MTTAQGDDAAPDGTSPPGQSGRSGQHSAEQQTSSVAPVDTGAASHASGRPGDGVGPASDTTGTHGEDGAAATTPSAPGSAVSGSAVSGSAVSGSAVSGSAPTGAPASSDGPSSIGTGASVSQAAAAAERELAEAAREAEEAVAAAHTDGAQAVEQGYEQARRATDEAYEQSHARSDTSGT